LSFEYTYLITISNDSWKEPKKLQKEGTKEEACPRLRKKRMVQRPCSHRVWQQSTHYHPLQQDCRSKDCCWQFERKSVRNIFGRLIEQKQQWILEKNEGIDWRSQRIRLLYQFLRNGHHKGQALPTCEEMAHNGWVIRSNQDFRWIHAKIVLHWVH